MPDEQKKDHQAPNDDASREKPPRTEKTEVKRPTIRIQKIPLETKIPPYFA